MLGEEIEVAVCMEQFAAVGDGHRGDEVIGGRNLKTLLSNVM